MRPFCFKDTDIDDLKEGKILTICFIPKKSPTELFTRKASKAWSVDRIKIVNEESDWRVFSFLFVFFLQEFWNLILMIH